MPAASPTKVLQRLSRQVDEFLFLWTENMNTAGYLENTTAKREDCILAFRWFMAPLTAFAEKGPLPSFGELAANTDNWAEKFIQTSHRHRSRGITGEMFIGCFKTLVHAILEMLDRLEEPRAQKGEAGRLIRRWADALETIIVKEWTAMSRQESTRSLDQANRSLTLEKCKYENVINSISDLVLTVDSRGRVLEANRSALKYFQKELTGASVFTLLGLLEQDLGTLYAAHSTEAPLEVSVGKLYFQCIFSPLNQVSLASDGYLVILRDVTALVRQSEIWRPLWPNGPLNC